MLPTNQQDLLTCAAGQLQQQLAAQTGTYYDIDLLLEVVQVWFEQSCQALAQEAFYHCHSGDRILAYNRPAFDDALKRLTAPTQSAITKRQPIMVVALRLKPLTRKKG